MGDIRPDFWHDTRPSANVFNLIQSSIGRRFGLYVGIAMILAGLGGLGLLLNSVARSQEESATRLLRTLAAAIAASYDAFDERQGRHPIGEITAELSSRDEIHQLDLFDHSGRIRWSVDPARRGTVIAPDILLDIATRTTSRAAGRKRSDALGTPRVIIPLRKRSACRSCHADDPDPIGGIHLAGSRGALLKNTAALAAPAVGVAVLMGLLVTALMLFLMNRTVLRPLGDLADVMDKAEDGDFLARVDVHTEDEIGSIATTFNKLLEKITDLRVEGIESERELDGVRSELSVAKLLEQKSAELAATNDRLNDRLVQLGFLYDLGRELASELDIDALLDHFGAMVHEALGVPEFAVLLLDEQKHHTRIVAARGFDEGTLHVGDRLAIDGTITSDAMKSRKPIYVADFAIDDHHLAYRSDADMQGSLLAVPVTYQGRLIGVLHYGSPEKDAFSDEERELFIAVGNHAALALANAQLFTETREMSLTDGLTGIPNRRALERRMELEWSKCERYDDNLSLVMVDIDFFKTYNDQQGHQLGDETLRRVALLLNRNIRKVDGIGRYGGEEFLIVLPRITKAEAINVAHKLRRSVEEADFERGFMQPLGRITISCGVATAPNDADGLEKLIRSADAALFEAKAAGRNQVVAAK